MATEPPLPDFTAFRAYVTKALYGSEAAPKVLEWSRKMEEWAKAAVADLGQSLARIEQLQKENADYIEELALMHNYENVALMAADVKRGIRDLEELMEVV